MMTAYRAIGGIGRGIPIKPSQPIVPGLSTSDTGTGAGGASLGVGNDQNNFGGASGGFGGASNNFGTAANDFGSVADSGFGGNRGVSSGSGCRICGQDGHFARECPNGGGSRGSKGACYKCGGDGHMSKNCPAGQDMTGFGGGFGSSENANAGGFGGGGGGRSSEPRTCNKCGQEGHIARNCPSDNGGGGGGGFGGSGSGFGGGGNNFRGGFGATDTVFGGGFGGGEDQGSRPRGRGCYNCGEEGHMSKDCPQPRKPREGGRSERGGGFGGGIDDGGFGGGDGGGSRGPKLCRNCSQEGHLARNCPSGGGGGGFGGGNGDQAAGGGRGGNCYNCGGEGHISKDCPEPRKEREPMKCFRCNEQGHMSKDCTNPPADGNENRKPPATHVPEEASIDNLWEEHIATGINFERYYNIPVEISGNDVEKFKRPLRTFGDAALSPEVLQNVGKAGFKRPTPIQQYAIPIILAGRDLMACAQTGSGKTAAFLLPILTGMLRSESMIAAEPAEKQEPGVIIVVPTRELALQIKDEARKFGSGTMVRVVVAYGGISMQHQLQRVHEGCNILVATPGRLLDLIGKGHIGLSKCKYLVLDEADRMLDLGFEAEVRKMSQMEDMPPKAERQTLMFSATFPDTVQQMAIEFLNDHVFVTIGKIGAANQDIKQELLLQEQYSKKDKLIELITADLEAFRTEDGSYNKKTLVFVERKRVADFVASILSQSGVSATSIHGDREQKERETALGHFKSGRCPVLVATAVAARGLDIKGVDHVINYDMPQSIEDYVHRIGRTGRVGNPGRATSFYDPEHDSQIASEVLNILTDAQQEVPEWFIDQVKGTGGGEQRADPTEDEFAAAIDLAASGEAEW